MRLTLRTLLAYLDDVLPPDQAKELGQKLTESNYATALVDRIKEVMRRRRLSAPDLFGKAAGIEPNVVAEYLDNELSPSEIADVEKICLDSDIHLAEVAACHQILTLVLGEPVDVRSETRARMYALGPVAKSDAISVNDLASAISMGTGPRPKPSFTASLSSVESESFDRTLPDYLKPKTSWRRTGVLALAALIIVGWLGLLLYDPTVRGARVNPQGVAAKDDAAIEADLLKEKAAGDDKTGATEQQNEPDEIASNVTIVAKNTKKTELMPDNELPIDDANRVVAKQPKIRPMPNDEPLNSDVVGDAPPKRVTPKPAEPPVPNNLDEPPALLARKVLYVSKEGVLLHFVDAKNDFFAMPRRSEIKPGDRLVCPEPFRADFTIGDDECQLALLGGSAVTTLTPTDKTSLGFDVSQGLVIFETKRLASDDADKAENKKPLAITISLRGQRHLLELMSDDALCGLEMRRREPTHFEIEPEAPGFTAGLHVTRGTVRWTPPEGKPVTIEGQGFVAVTADSSANIKTSEIGRPSQMVSPEWLEPDPKRYASKQKRLYNTTFEKEFDINQALLLSLPAIINSPRPAISELAVKCLSLTDSYQPLIKALLSADHREARLAAITGLRLWLPVDPQNRQLLKAEIARHLLPSEAEAVYRLLWGFNHDDAKNAATSHMLVNWLESEQIAIRELAFWHVQKLTGLKHEYSPINPPGQRRVAVERWNLHLEKKGGALVQD